MAGFGKSVHEFASQFRVSVTAMLWILKTRGVGQALLPDGSDLTEEAKHAFRRYESDRMSIGREPRPLEGVKKKARRKKAEKPPMKTSVAEVTQPMSEPSREQLQSLLDRFSTKDRSVLAAEERTDSAAKEEARRKRRLENKQAREDAERRRAEHLAALKRKRRAKHLAQEALAAILRPSKPRPFFGSLDPVHDDND
jgi:hypothetical protein